MFQDDRPFSEQFDMDGCFIEHPVIAASLAIWDRDYTAHPMPDGRRGYGTCDWPGLETIDNPWPPKPPSFEIVVRRRTKQHIPSELRWRVWERDDFRCQSCGTRIGLSIDHILAKSKGGKTIFENLQTLCVPCNCRKGAK